MKPQLLIGMFGLVVVSGSGCVGKAPEPVGNATLGIADFQITETATATTVIGVDAQHQEVGRLELIHGWFMPTEDFGPQYNGRMIDGRKLKVAINGLQLDWETLGYSDTLHMPAMPPSGRAVAEFVEDATVRPLLQAWKIGWVGGVAAAGGETAYTSSACDYSYPGSNPSQCNLSGGTGTCAILSGTSGNVAYNGVTTPACNGNAEWEGIRLDRRKSNGAAYDGNLLYFCCGSSTSGSLQTKSCAAYTGQGGGCTGGNYCSDCGNSGSNKCLPCGVWSGTYSENCALSTAADGGGLSVACYELDCAAGGHSCSTNADCCNSHCEDNYYCTNYYYGSCTNWEDSPTCSYCAVDGGSCSTNADCCNSDCTFNYYCTNYYYGSCTNWASYGTCG